MITTEQFNDLCEKLRQNPDLIVVIPDGTAILALANEKDDLFMGIKAPDGVNFHTMSDEEVQAFFAAALEEF